MSKDVVSQPLCFVVPGSAIVAMLPEMETLLLLGVHESAGIVMSARAVDTSAQRVHRAAVPENTFTQRAKRVAQWNARCFMAYRTL
jgi:hypothetical protein